MLSIVVGENESSKFWLGVLNSLKNRGVQDVLILCSDGLTGIKDAISTAFPKTEQQRCIVHMVRNTLKYVANKDMKAFDKDLKTIYTAANEESALARLEAVTENLRSCFYFNIVMNSFVIVESLRLRLKLLHWFYELIALERLVL